MISEEVKYNFLIDQLRQGCHLAFTQLYHQYNKQLYRSILYLVKDEDIAEEILQDLFLKIWIIREDLDPEKSFKSFLYQVGINMVYKYFREVAKDQRLVDQLKIKFTELDTFAEEVIINKENLNLLNSAIESLPPKRKQIFILCKIEGKSYEEVSLQLGISTGTIQSQIVKANKVVKAFFIANHDLLLVLMVTEMITRNK